MEEEAAPQQVILSGVPTQVNAGAPSGGVYLGASRGAQGSERPAPTANPAAAGKAPRSKNLAGRLPIAGVGCIFSLGREVKTEIPAFSSCAARPTMSQRGA